MNPFLLVLINVFPTNKLHQCSEVPSIIFQISHKGNVSYMHMLLLTKKTNKGFIEVTKNQSISMMFLITVMPLMTPIK